MLYIHTSKIATILGYNKYITQDKYVQIFIDYLYKNKDELKNNDSIINNIQILNSDEKTNLIIGKILNDSNEEQKNNIVTILDSKIKTSDNLKQHSQTINNIINDLQYNKLEKSVIKTEIEKIINCNYGINTESIGIKKYEQLTNSKVYNSNIQLYVINFDNYKICGKVDGFVKINNKEYLIEIKNRKNKLFDTIPIYEQIQILAYTKLVNNNNIVFIQNINKDININILDNYINDNLWNEIIKKLNLYIELINKFHNNDELRYDFIKKNKRQKYKFISEYINN
jgi:hypothetical protein